MITGWVVLYFHILLFRLLYKSAAIPWLIYRYRLPHPRSKKQRDHHQVSQQAQGKLVNAVAMAYTQFDCAGTQFDCIAFMEGSGTQSTMQICVEILASNSYVASYVRP